MTTLAAVIPLLRIRTVAALVLHHAGYLPDQITAHLGPTTTQATPADLTPQLLTAASQYLRDSGFTYWGIPEATTKLHATLTPQPTTKPPTEPEDDHQAWDHGLLFDIAATTA
ncbi:hypothetical protein [Streptomyces coelicoflavus]|uniref:hypothetical protein n=1 Tax=Streptomyces coelicoflavus TaxID=285562 RepID=UPI00362637BF